MLEIYYGNAVDKNRLCIGAAVQAALRNKNVLFVRFLRGDQLRDRQLCGYVPNIVFITPDIPIVLEELGEDKRPQAAKALGEFFDKAARMALTFKYKTLLLDRVFDVTSAGLLSESEVYGFLSNAPDTLEIICTGLRADDRFLALADEIVELTNTANNR